MFISVIYQDNKMGIVEDSKLDELISSSKIKQFLRSDGWVTIGGDPIRRRRNRDDYEGRERRRQ
jgi:hypothetical protein